MSEHYKLPFGALSPTIDLATADFGNLPDFIIPGQKRADKALAFGLQVNRPGYHIFVLGEPGWDCLEWALAVASGLAVSKPTPDAILYVENFSNRKQPRLIRLPAGQGRTFCRDIENLMGNLVSLLPLLAADPAFLLKKSSLERVFQRKVAAAIEKIAEHCRDTDIGFVREDHAVRFQFMRGGVIVPDTEFAKLSPAEQSALDQQLALVEAQSVDLLAGITQWQLTLRQDSERLLRETWAKTTQPLFAPLLDTYRDNAAIQTYLRELSQHLASALGESGLLEVGGYFTDDGFGAGKSSLARRCMPNLLTDYESAPGAPLVYEPDPSLKNLFGRQAYFSSTQGAMMTGAATIAAGSLHRANGGYLVLEAEKLLQAEGLWSALKTALKTGVFAVSQETVHGQGISLDCLQPEPVPLDLKVILLGSEEHYFLLDELDADGAGLFKVLADFDPFVDLTPQSLGQLVSRVRQHAQALGSQPMSDEAIKKVVEIGCRQAEHQAQFSAKIAGLLDLVTEAEQFSRMEASAQIGVRHIEQAIAAMEERNGKLSESVLQEMLDGGILIDTSGQAIGKINGLTLIEMGGSCFGAPARITATVYPGSRGIVDIEREVELGQAIHSKGVMILTGYLGHCYAQQFPLAISANIAIEQSYGFIDGDSASLAELCCLISALTRTPIHQSVAVTGSINQYGEVQAIGGVNEKVEGFFRLCRARGLNGEQGVIVPAANQRNLVLNREVVEAVEAGLFAVYAVETVDQALEILTGMTAGTIDREGKYPADSLNAKAIQRLKEISDLALDDDKEEG